MKKPFEYPSLVLAAAFSIYAGDGDGHGYDSGYQCAISRELSEAQKKPAAVACRGVEWMGQSPGL